MLFAQNLAWAASSYNANIFSRVYKLHIDFEANFWCCWMPTMNCLGGHSHCDKKVTCLVPTINAKVAFTPWIQFSSIHLGVFPRKKNMHCCFLVLAHLEFTLTSFKWIMRSKHDNPLFKWSPQFSWKLSHLQNWTKPHSWLGINQNCPFKIVYVLFMCSSCYSPTHCLSSPRVFSLFTRLHRRIDDDMGRTHELEHSAIKCMRGILYCYMRQADKVSF